MNRGRLFRAAKEIIQMRNSAIDQFVNSKPTSASNLFADHVTEPDNFSVIMLLDLDHVQQTIQDLTRAFPSNFLHTFAAKANPVRVCTFT